MSIYRMSSQTKLKHSRVGVRLTPVLPPRSILVRKLHSVRRGKTGRGYLTEDPIDTTLYEVSGGARVEPGATRR